MFNYKVAFSYQALGMTYKVCKRFSLPFLPCCRHLQILLLHAQILLLHAHFKCSFPFPLLISIILNVFFPFFSLPNVKQQSLKFVWRACFLFLVPLIMEQNHINDCYNSQIGARKLLLLSNMLHVYSEVLYTDGLPFFFSPFCIDVFFGRDKILDLVFC